MMQSTKNLASHATRVLLAWGAITILAALSLLFVFLWKGSEGLKLIVIEGPLSRLQITLSAVIIVWLEAGLFLLLLRAGRITRANVFTWVGFFLVTIIYVSILRERTEYWDAYTYIRGAQALLDKQPFGRTFIYPPFWAILLKPLAPLGEKQAIDILWVFNVFALGLFYFLVIRVLQKYGFSERLAALTVTLFMLVNTPLLRTMLYMQVNLHILNLVFISLLLQKKSPFWSALAMAVAIHFKVSPAALALAFLLERDWRWLGWVTFHTLWIFGLTILSDGFQPYLDFLYNLSLLNLPHGLNYRETSFDSFFWALEQLADLNYSIPRILTYISKFALAAVSFIIMARAIKNRAFDDGETPNLLNAIPPLMIIMNMFSPLVWEHHGVFLVLVFLLLFKKIQTPAEWTWFGVAYFLEYLLPTFDVFPWSYGRLVAVFIVLWLMWQVSQRKEDSLFFGRVNRTLENLELAQ